MAESWYVNSITLVNPMGGGQVPEALIGPNFIKT